MLASVVSKSLRPPLKPFVLAIDSQMRCEKATYKIFQVVVLFSVLLRLKDLGIYSIDAFY